MPQAQHASIIRLVPRPPDLDGARTMKGAGEVGITGSRWMLLRELLGAQAEREFADAAHLELTPHAFLTRLASLVPRPRKNTSLYFGALAGNARRSAIRTEDASWAALMKHSLGLDVLGCPRPGCKGRLTFVAVIFDRDEVKRLVAHLRLFTEPIPLQSAREPPELWTEAYDFD